MVDLVVGGDSGDKLAVVRHKDMQRKEFNREVYLISISSDPINKCQNNLEEQVSPPLADIPDKSFRGLLAIVLSWSIVTPT